MRHPDASREEAARQEAAPGPRLVRQSHAHGGSRGIGTPLGAALDEVAPPGGQEQALHDGVEAPPEGDGLALLVGAGVAEERVQLVHGIESAGEGEGGA